MASKGQKAAGVLAATFAAAAIATPALISHEGWITKTYGDPRYGAALPTACAGVTGAGVAAGHTYTDAECEQMTAQALIRIGLAIAPCLPEKLPDQTRAAFLDFAYNVGPGAFCKSSVAKRAQEGNLGAACGALRLYVYAGGRKLPGLVNRRAEEQVQCERGLRR